VHTTTQLLDQRLTILRPALVTQSSDITQLPNHEIQVFTFGAWLTRVMTSAFSPLCRGGANLGPYPTSSSHALPDLGLYCLMVPLFQLSSIGLSCRSLHIQQRVHFRTISAQRRLQITGYQPPQNKYLVLAAHQHQLAPRLRIMNNAVDDRLIFLATVPESRAFLLRMVSK
jgi:hypothetical protein